LLERFGARALAQVEELVTRFHGTRALATRELAAYGRRFGHGWEIPGLCAGSGHQLRILIPSALPFHPPRVAVSPAPRSLSWPHVEDHGLLCLLPDAAGHSILDPQSVVLTLLADAVDLVGAGHAGSNLEHFEAEFLSYWARWDKTTAAMSVMCRPEGPTRWVSSWHGERKALFAENVETLRRWVHNTHGAEAAERLVPQAMPLLWLPRPLRPSEYPTAVSGLLSLVGELRAGPELVEQLLLDQGTGYKSLVLGFNSPHGAGFVGLNVVEPNLPPGRESPLTKGFRGRPPRGVLLTRYRGFPLIGATARRFDASWTLGRDHNPSVRDLQARSAVVLGVGSVGASVAELLAKAGVGRIVLVDEGVFDSANIGRHVLGAQALGANKASALAQLLSARFPHLTINDQPSSLEEVNSRSPDLLRKADLIISTMGNWRSESLLSALAVDAADLPPILFGWTEAHAAAGHAVVCFPRQGCLRCISDDSGHPSLAVATWPTGGALVPVPACGGFFQPYGAIELAHIHALIADLAVEVLLGQVTASTHRVWVGRRKVIQSNSGAWNAKWIARYGDPGEGGLILTVGFNPDPHCPLCVAGR